MKLLKKGQSALESSALRQYDLYHKKQGAVVGGVIKEEEGSAKINADVQFSSTDSLQRMKKSGSLNKSAAAFVDEILEGDKFEERLKEATEEYKILCESRTELIKVQF